MPTSLIIPKIIYVFSIIYIIIVILLQIHHNVHKHVGNSSARYSATLTVEGLHIKLTYIETVPLSTLTNSHEARPQALITIAL